MQQEKMGWNENISTWFYNTNKGYKGLYFCTKFATWKIAWNGVFFGLFWWEKKNTRKQIEGFLYSIIVMRKKNIIVVFLWFHFFWIFQYFNLKKFPNMKMINENVENHKMTKNCWIVYKKHFSWNFLYFYILKQSR